MYRGNISAFFIVCATILPSVYSAPPVELNNGKQPPVARQIPHVIEINGRNIEDEYGWIRDPNWPSVTDSKILDYVKAENDYADQFFTPLNGKKRALFEELKSRMKTKDETPYEEIDDWLYYAKIRGDERYPIYCRKYENADAAEDVILDVNKIAEGRKYTKVKGVSVSPDHKYLAYAVDHVGNEKFVIKIMDMKEKFYLRDEIHNAASVIVWHEKIAGIFYLPLNDIMRKDKVLFHHLHGNVENDKFVFGINDRPYTLHATASASRKYMFVDVISRSNNEIHALDITEDKQDFTPVLIKEMFAEEGVVYEVVHAGDKFYVRTNFGAKNYRVIAAPESDPSDWSDIYVPEGESYLKGIDATEKYLLMTYKEEGLNVMKVKSFADVAIKSIVFPDASYSARCFASNYRLNYVQIKYSSLRRPETTYRYDYESGELTVSKASYSIPGFESNDYDVERIRVASSNGEDENEEIVSIPVTILYKKSLFQKDGRSPMYMFAYGAYGICAPTHFASAPISLADRGFLYVVAHVRGGGEWGNELRHQSAKLLNKKRTFRDFIAVAKYLIAERYTDAGNIVASGSGAGGTLIGAVLNEWPNLLKAAVADVPFVDVLNTMLDESLPLTPLEFKEWGNPIADVLYFDYIKSYCPYTNVQKQAYPHMFVKAAISDIGVGYWEALKYVARLRKLKTDQNVALLKTEMNTRHSSASRRFDYLKQHADELIFIFQIFGVVV